MHTHVSGRRIRKSGVLAPGGTVLHYLVPGTSTTTGMTLIEVVKYHYIVRSSLVRGWWLAVVADA